MIRSSIFHSLSGAVVEKGTRGRFQLKLASWMAWMREYPWLSQALRQFSPCVAIDTTSV